MKRIRLLSCILAALILMSAVPMTGAAQTDATAEAAVDTLAAEEAVDDAAQATSDTEATKEKVPSYESYLYKTNYEDADQKDDAAPITVYVGSESIADWKRTDKFVMPFSVEKEGFYTLTYDYQYVEAGNKNTTYDILLDGKIPYQDASSRTFSRMWENEVEITTDPNTGDDINPKQVEVRYWRTYTVYDKEGYYPTPIVFYLSKGEHTLTFDQSTDFVAFKNVEFVYDKALPTYEEYKNSVASTTVYDGADNVVVQGESAVHKSEMYLIAQNDITDPLTQSLNPDEKNNSASKIRLNTFGGANWKLTGETAEWTVVAPKAGMYKMSIRFRQQFYDGVSAHRRLYVNGVVPFAEANALEFAYDTKWQSLVLRNEAKEDLYVYLNEGENTIALEVMLGSSAKIAEELQECVLEMNTIYRQVIMITGSSPDDYRDYNIDKQIPNLVQDLTKARDRLNGIADEVALQYGKKSSLIAKINNITRQLDLMIEKPAQISKSDRLGSFKSNISTIGSWIAMFCEQPLEIDRIEFYGDNGKPVRAEANIIESLGHTVRRFVASFTEDYSSVGSSTEDTGASVKVWIQAGRDQANVLKQQITSDFTPNSGVTIKDEEGKDKEVKVGVELELVTGAIIEATLAGKGPDVALSRAVTDPVNFAMRNALCDLSKFEDYDEVVEKNFVPGAMIPFQYNGGVYALPETMSYQMMFVRTDIMEELGIEAPKTWDELLVEVYPIVSRNNMEVGIGNMNQISAMNASNIFTNLLYQMGGKIYNDELNATALDTQVAYKAFERSVELYADYGFPQEYDAMSRFRTGEMPILLADYTMYNVFSISIPELDGLWEMVPIPGEPVLDENGNPVLDENGEPMVDNSQAATEVASVMFKCDEVTERAGWEFLKWWVERDTQAEFGTRIEAILGSGGRYATANKDALEDLPWNEEQLDALHAQMDHLVFVEQLPGSYFTSRAINSAFMTSVLNSENPTEQLLYWSEQINLELTRKIEEFSDDTKSNDTK